jgi:hypothetical protein
MMMMMVMMMMCTISPPPHMPKWCGDTWIQDVVVSILDKNASDSARDHVISNSCRDTWPWPPWCQSAVPDSHFQPSSSIVWGKIMIIHEYQAEAALGVRGAWGRPWPRGARVSVSRSVCYRKCWLCLDWIDFRDLAHEFSFFIIHKVFFPFVDNWPSK